MLSQFKVPDRSGPSQLERSQMFEIVFLWWPGWSRWSQSLVTDQGWSLPGPCSLTRCLAPLKGDNLLFVVIFVSSFCLTNCVSFQFWVLTVLRLVTNNQDVSHSSHPDDLIFWAMFSFDTTLWNGMGNTLDSVYVPNDYKLTWQWEICIFCSHLLLNMIRSNQNLSHVNITDIWVILFKALYQESVSQRTAVNRKDLPEQDTGEMPTTDWCQPTLVHHCNYSDCVRVRDNRKQPTHIPTIWANLTPTVNTNVNIRQHCVTISEKIMTCNTLINSTQLQLRCLGQMFPQVWSNFGVFRPTQLHKVVRNHLHIMTGLGDYDSGVECKSGLKCHRGVI